MMSAARIENIAMCYKILSYCWVFTKAGRNPADRSMKRYQTSPSHIHTLLSRLQLERKLPDGDQATAFTSFSWPSSVATHSKLSSSLRQIQIVASKLPEAKYRPHGDQATLRIVRLCPSARMALQVHSLSSSAMNSVRHITTARAVVISCKLCEHVF